VIDLFDSIYSGYPVGVLLLARRDDEAAARVTFGPVVINAPEMRESYFIVDGQQRVTSLVAAFCNPDVRPRSGVFALWFDLESRRFIRPVSGVEVPSTCIPVNALRDMPTLMRWLDDWPLRKERLDLLHVAHELLGSLLDYTVPVYYFDGTSPSALRLIFKRVNTTGVRMQEDEVFNALFMHGGPKPLRSALVRLHEATGFGLLSEGLLLRCVKSVLGVEPKESVDLEGGDAKVPNDTLGKTEAALQRAIAFLQEDAGFPHASIVPYPSPVLIVLSRYFSLHSKPSARSRLLLRWWVWRGALSKQHSSSSQGYISRLQRLVVAGDDEIVAQSVLRDAPTTVSIPRASIRWNPRSAEVRACMAALLAHSPIPDSADISIDPVDDDDESSAVISVDDQRPDWLFRSCDGKRPRFVSDALVIAGSGDVDVMKADSSWLESQLVPVAAVEALRSGDEESFRRYREELLDPWLQQFLAERYGAGESDRVSILGIVRSAEGATG
jgi:hypothetical protein